ncbi:riboflavin synthase subunit alpha [Thalassomonas haliotis]|uniref:Riboflavin synthase n=1 Tax=Thalassomonas haliotis TaxID=485448 RepID=A0ABY7V7F8_9GAMM|nr:riboflavin synthase subunit alpha [Thalassomonas haliotis]WDE09605.1 riboflavin synthase subunit alpha [Thalassomonas haliotis]
MFTGIVQSQAEVLAIKTKNNLCRLTLATALKDIEQLELGASIAVNGVCLTVVEFASVDKNHAYISFDVIDETLAVTNLGVLTPNDRVNIERSLKVGDELGGHTVSGHVHCQAELIEKHATSSNCRLVFACAADWMKYILPKGFIAINGISLTLGEVVDNQFSVHLIPETLARTNLNQLSVDDKVNLEFDQQTITIVTTLERMNLA